jgi:hypothetical protein
MEQRRVSLSNHEMLHRLRSLLKEKGRLSKTIINNAVGFPWATMYQLRCGSLRNAYKLIGYDPKRDFEYIDARRSLIGTLTDLVSDIVIRIEGAGGTADFDRTTDPDNKQQAYHFCPCCSMLARST